MNASNIPVALIIFNRPACAVQSMARIRSVRPSKLYVIADGPRKHKAGERDLCNETREIVESTIDWPCDLIKVYAEENMGCGSRLPSGLNRVFAEESHAIILEDDVIPDPSFFPFCTHMLEKYKDVNEIMQIGAYNRFSYAPPDGSSYFYSRFSDIWGWATWRRAWEKFSELDAEKWQSIRTSTSFAQACFSEREAEMRQFCLDEIFSGQLSAWGMRWDVTKILHGGLGIVPSVNLAQNIGFGVDASHTVNPLNRHRFMKARALPPPYLGPGSQRSNTYFDQRYNRKMFPNHVLTEKVRTGILKLIGKK